VAPEHRDSVEISASPEAVFELASDLPGMGRFSPENRGGEWVGGARAPALGVRFRGANAQGRLRWRTTATVTDFDPPRRFSFQVRFLGAPISTWSYEVTAREGSCELAETWRDDRGWLTRTLTRTVPDREAFTKLSVRQTLESMRAHLEGGAA
jgi:hypothetical protein